ncbi:MAG TPA: UDP-N-acetylmuramoyl-tripeptide--D-alanyl-D-alanine ligase [Steroidobacteraceae bacterium]|nr:UDP-N-acetylmuramoyl-tripeptide--D-alanyl-D-alanine ligase [Steroidobacteraceae bacterium]
MIRDLAEFARVAGGRLDGANAAFGAVTTDSRAVERGELFVALRGERFDAHDFVRQAAERGCAGAVVSRKVKAAVPQVVVADTLEALTAFARAWRHDFSGTVVGLTGSNGKTTVKEMIGAILGRCGPCLVTQGNLNNHIGVPLTLARLEAGHRYAVIEMGANHRGEIAHLASIARPDVGLVINAGPAHLEGFGGIEGVARGKGEMFEALGVECAAVVNADDRYAAFWHGLAREAGRIVTFGVREHADFMAGGVECRLADDGFVTDFDLTCPLGRSRVSIALAGEHNVMNALAAAATAAAAGASLDAITAGLGSVRPVAGRLQLRAALNGARLVDDSYNANPGSVRAGLKALATVPGEHWLVLGEMRELGEDSARLHEEIGDLARTSGIRRLFAVGEDARRAVEAYGAGGLWFADVEELVAAARPHLRSGVTVLVKGSRSNRLERVADALAAEGAPGRGGH